MSPRCKHTSVCIYVLKLPVTPSPSCPPHPCPCEVQTNKNPVTGRRRRPRRAQGHRHVQAAPRAARFTRPGGPQRPVSGPGREDRPGLWNAPSSVPFSAGGAKDYRTSVALNSRRPPGDAAAVTEFPGTVLTANASRGRRPSQDPVVPSPLRLRSEVRRAELCPVAGEAPRCLFHATPSSSD